MARFLARRAITLLPVFLLMTVIVFMLIRMIPGDPIDVMYGSEGMDAARRAALSTAWGWINPL